MVQSRQNQMLKMYGPNFKDLNHWICGVIMFTYRMLQLISEGRDTKIGLKQKKKKVIKSLIKMIY